MSSTPVLPLFLQKGYLSNLNDQLFDKTGCFAFLCTDRAICATNPISWQDAFSIIVPGLYSVYHDYACQFLFILLDDNNSGFQPDGFIVPKGFIPHINAIEKTLRPNLTHGILYHLERNHFQNMLLNFYLRPYYQSKGIIPPKYSRWTDLIESMDEEQWEYVVTRIVNDSDNLYNHLLKWSLEWEKKPTELSNLKSRFSSDYRFIQSFDGRVCSPIIRASLYDAHKNLNLTKSYITNSLPNWQIEMVNHFRNGERPNVLYAELEKIIRNEIIPSRNQSSVSIANKFNLP